MKARLYLTTTAIFWGLNFHFAKFMMEETSYAQTATWKYVIGVVPLLLISRKSLLKLNFKTMPLKGILLVGVIGLFSFNYFFFLGLKYTEPLNAALIISLTPIITIWLSAMVLKTQITRYHIIGAIISIIGVAILLSKGNLSYILALKLNFGDFIVLLGSFAFALYNVWTKQYKGDFSNSDFTALTNVLCLLCFFILLGFNREGLSLDHSNAFWLWAIGLGGFGTALAYLLWNEGLSHLGADSAGLFINIVPLATAISAILMGEQLHIYHAISGIIIIGGVLISQRKTQSTP